MNNRDDRLEHAARRGITLYLHVHQPWRIRKYSIFDTATHHDYFKESTYQTDRNNQYIIDKVADKSYRPMNTLLLRLLESYPDFKLSLSITGTFIEQCERFAPDVIESFQKLVQTGRVEIVAETYYHSLAFFYDQAEFEAQVDAHAKKIKQVFGVSCSVFRNTELAYNDQLAQWADNYGYKGILAEGWDAILDWRSPNFVYQPNGTKNIKLLMKNYRLSDDIAFRFSNKDWKNWPLHADTYQQWAEQSLLNGQTINLFMDYETFGEHQWAETGIFIFFESFVGQWLSNTENTFYTVSETIDTHEASGIISMPHTVTWADNERDLSAWLGNSMQHEAMRHLYDLSNDVMRSDDLQLISDWRKLQTSDHSYYMCTKWFSDGDVHAYFSPYESPYDAFLYYMNALRDIRFRVMENKSYYTLRGLHR